VILQAPNGAGFKAAQQRGPSGCVTLPLASSQLHKITQVLKKLTLFFPIFLLPFSLKEYQSILSSKNHLVNF
jgi:hypothetical protein